MTIKKFPLRWMIWVSIHVLIGTGILLIVSKVNHEPSSLRNRLSEIQSQLNSLQDIMKAPADTTINHDVQQLEAMIQELQSKDDSQLNKLVVESRTQLENKLDAMHATIQSLEKKQHPIKYLGVNTLPFKIISIDSIQQVSVASVSYDYKTFPLEKSDVLAGWTVLSIDFSKQTIEFENGNKEHVLVALEGASEHA